MIHRRDRMAPLLVTMGEPAGIGPEITAKCWEERKAETPVFAVVGDPAVYSAFAVPVAEIDTPAAAADRFADALPVLPVKLAKTPVPGQPDTANAPTVLACIERAVGLVRAGEATAVVTNPIHKAVLYRAGMKHPGHTEWLAELCNRPVEEAVMMLAIPGLRVVPVTVHIALAEVAAALTTDRIVRVTRIAHADLVHRFGLEHPRIALAGLNPHAGEGGRMGDEEAQTIRPAVEALREADIQASGPWPADTLFHERARAHQDCIICMYHDQALIPLKTIDFDHGVNITLGLPIIRTSPDHGTALDIAGQGCARQDSLACAIMSAGDLAARACHDAA